MRIVITVNHVVSIDPAFADLLKAIFPNQTIIDELEANIKQQTKKLSDAVAQDTPAT